MNKKKDGEKLVDAKININVPKHNIDKPKRKAMRAFWGVYFLAAAVIVLLQGFGVITIGANIGILMALIALLSLAIAFIMQRFWLGSFMAVASGVTIASATGLIPALTGEQVGMTFAAAGLAGVAFHILFHRSWRKNSMKYVGRDGSNHADVSFTGTTKYFKDEAFEKALLDCSFGDIKAYFEEVKLKGKTARIKIDNNFGAIELFLPKNWAVDNQLNMSFGGVSEQNHPALTPDSPQIILEGEVNFGGVTITYI
ncbi:MAG: hypothetical protein ACK5MU_03530 [Candidatus Saccharimonadales bacterium]